MPTDQELTGDIVFHAQRMMRMLEIGPPLTLFREYWVDSQYGDDRNPGTEEDPFASLDHALDQVPVGGHTRIRLIKRSVYIIQRDHVIKHAVVEVDTPGATAGSWGQYAEFSSTGKDAENVFQIVGDGAFIQLSNISIQTPGLNADPVQTSLFRVRPLSSMFLNLFWVQARLAEAHLMRGGVGSVSSFSATSSRFIPLGVDVGEAIALHAQGNVAICEMSQCTFTGIGATVTDFVDGVTFAADGEPRNVHANFNF